MAQKGVLCCYDNQNDHPYKDIYWTTEKMRSSSSLTDTSVSLRRLRLFGDPDKIYNSYIENGVVKTAIKEYSISANEKWNYQFDIGEGIATSIVFDGTFERVENKLGFKTVEIPFVFWVDTSNKLWVKLWDETEQQELAAGVSKVKSIRAWKGTERLDNDMGIVCAYIKNEKAYYRNYCIQPDGKLAWEEERKIADNALDINLFLTNDYRLGIAIKDSSEKIKILITKREWVGAAITPDVITAAPINVVLTSTEITSHDLKGEEFITVAPVNISAELGYTLTDNIFHEAINVPIGGDWGKAIEFTVEHTFYNLTNSDFEIVGNETVYPDIVTRIDAQRYRLEFVGNNDFHNVGNLATLKYLGRSSTNALHIPYEPFSITFEPLNLVPYEKPAPIPLKAKNTSEKTIEVEFDLELLGFTTDLSQAFIITGLDYQYVNSPDYNGPLQNLAHEVTSVIRKDKRTIILTCNTLDRISGDLTVNYDQTKGNLSGNLSIVKSFAFAFIPVGIVPANPGHVELITVVPVKIELISQEVTYHDVPAIHGTITASPISITLVSTDIGVVDP